MKDTIEYSEDLMNEAKRQNTSVISIKDDCNHQENTWTKWNSSEKEFIINEMRCNYSIIKDRLPMDFLSYVKTLRRFLCSGISYSMMDSLFEELYYDGDLKDKVIFESVENRLLSECGLSMSSLRMTKCPNGHFCHGSYIFCRKCLQNKIIVRRLQGCKVDTCFANNKFWDNYSKENLDPDDFMNITCTHQRNSSSEFFYSMTPVAHIVLLTNCGFDDRITNSTRTEIYQLVKKCKENKTISPQICHNCIYSFSYLNEIDISSWIESIYCSLYNPASLRNSMKDEVDKLVSVNSIEKLLYKFSRSIFTV